ncbi:Ubx Domain-Containing Protein 1 [Manis pentadactyla]|nr:Ubx Domain-Containing Protein 1 [Manis pentadactyla]
MRVPVRQALGRHLPKTHRLRTSNAAVKTHVEMHSSFAHLSAAAKKPFNGELGSPSGTLEGDSLVWLPSGSTEQLLPNRNRIVADLRC